MKNSAHRDVKRAALNERRRKALELRKAGATYDQIKTQMGYATRASAARDCFAAIRAIIAEPAEEVRQLELQRLDALLLGVWKKAKDGDPAAVDRVLRIMDRRAAYLGLDAPKEQHVSVHAANATPAEARRIMNELFPGEVTPVGELSPDETSEGAAPE